MGDDNYSPFFHQKSSYDTNTKILLSAIVSLSLVVILVIILHIYARCLMRRQARRESALRRLNFIISTHAAAIDARNNGLDPSVVASLPLHLHKRSETDSNDKEMGFSLKECSVCLSTYEDGEMVRTLPNCKHSFHAECIDKWFGSNSTCPVCRMEAEPAAASDAAGAPPSAPPLEGTSGGGGGGDHKVGRSMSSRFSYSFRRMLSRERSARRMQSSAAGDFENGGTDRDQGP